MNGEKRKRGANPRLDCPPHCSLPHPPDGETEAHGGEALFVRCWQAQGAQVLSCNLCPPRYVASPGSDLCTRPSSASEASRAVKRRHLCSRPRCCRRSRAVVRRSGDSISHSGLSGHRAQSPEPPPLPPPLPSHTYSSQSSLASVMSSWYTSAVPMGRPWSLCATRWQDPDAPTRQRVYCRSPPCSPREQCHAWATEPGQEHTQPGQERDLRPQPATE